MRPQPSSPADTPAARDFTIPQMEPAPRLALKRPVVPLLAYLGMLVICILNIGMLSLKPMCLGSQHEAPLADLQAAVSGGHFSAGRGGAMPAQERPASAS